MYMDDEENKCIVVFIPGTQAMESDPHWDPLAHRLGSVCSMLQVGVTSMIKMKISRIKSQHVRLIISMHA